MICVSRVEKGLQKILGVSAAIVDLAAIENDVAAPPGGDSVRRGSRDNGEDREDAGRSRLPRRDVTGGSTKLTPRELHAGCLRTIVTGGLDR